MILFPPRLGMLFHGRFVAVIRCHEGCSNMIEPPLEFFPVV